MPGICIPDTTVPESAVPQSAVPQAAVPQSAVPQSAVPAACPARRAAGRPDRAALGREAEQLAAAHLEAAGAEILLRNFRRRRGELDLVAMHRGVVLVVEVRLRSSDRHGGGAASVDRRKQRRIVNATQQLLQQRRDLARHPLRFDVIAVSPCPPDTAATASPASTARTSWRLDWLKHAFDAAAN